MESRVHADVAVVDSVGQVRFWFGNPNRATFWRSSAKPFQAMPIIESGAAEQFGFGSREVAITCASHGGEPFHVELVQDLLNRIHAEPQDLICGVHPPSHRESALALVAKGQDPFVLHNNCSGKHTGMLTLARALNAPLAGYEKPEHPVQQAIRANVAYMSGMESESLYTGVDGCGVPCFYMPLTRMAYSYARLVDPRGLDTSKAGAAMIIAEAMRLHPELVSGTGRLEVTLAEASHHRFVSKGGAEAVFCLGIPDKGLGLAVKVDDGNSRVIPTLVTATLEQIGVLSTEERMNLQSLIHPEIRNHAGRLVGDIRVTMQVVSGRL